MGTLLLLDIPKVPSNSTIQELLKSVFGMFGIKNLTGLDSDHMCMTMFKWSKSQTCLSVWCTYRKVEIYPSAQFASLTFITNYFQTYNYRFHFPCCSNHVGRTHICFQYIQLYKYMFHQSYMNCLIVHCYHNCKLHIHFQFCSNHFGKLK